MFKMFRQLSVRKVGRMSTSALGYGCMGLSEFYGKPLSRQEAVGIIRNAYENGITHFDTADIYAFGENEEIVGEAIKPFRDQITIATKCGIIRRKDDPSARGVTNQPNYIIRACDESLKRLGVDCIDLFYLHRIDAQVPIEESVAALAKLVEQKKIKYIGLSEADAETIERAHKIHPITAVQTEYSLWTRGIESNGIYNICKKLDIGIVAYSPLGRGFLTGAIKNPTELETTDFRRTLPRFAEDRMETNFKLVVLVEQMAKEKNCTPAQLALAWILEKDECIVPIPGTKNLNRLVENLGAVQIKLSKDEIVYLDRISMV